MEIELDKMELNKNYPDSIIYINKLNELDNGFDTLISNFKQLYVMAKMRPTDETYQQQYQSLINSLREILSKLYSISNEINLNIDDINSELFKLNKMIKKERKINRELKQKLGIVEHESNASSEMIDDYINIYNDRYYRNLSIFIGIIIGILTIKKTFI